jgi:mRNA interferase MazF
VVKRGEVWWHEAENEKRRPYLILTRDEAIPVLTALLAVPATRTIRGIPSEVPLSPRHGMPTECVLTLDNVTVVRKAHLVERIAQLDMNVLDDVGEALGFAAGCSPSARRPNL